MKHLTATIYLTIAVLLGSVGVSWGQKVPSLSALDYETKTIIEFKCIGHRRDDPIAYQKCLSEHLFIEPEKQKIKVRQREAAKRLALLEVETTNNINDFKTKAMELCREQYLGNRQNAKREFERRFPQTKLPAWMQPLFENEERRKKLIYTALFSPVERAESICAKEMFWRDIRQENAKYDAALKDERVMQRKEEDRLRKLEQSEKERKEYLRQQERDVEQRRLYRRSADFQAAGQFCGKNKADLVSQVLNFITWGKDFGDSPKCRKFWYPMNKKNCVYKRIGDRSSLYVFNSLGHKTLMLNDYDPKSFTLEPRSVKNPIHLTPYIQPYEIIVQLKHAGEILISSDPMNEREPDLARIHRGLNLIYGKGGCKGTSKEF